MREKAVVEAYLSRRRGAKGDSSDEERRGSGVRKESQPHGCFKKQGLKEQLSCLLMQTCTEEEKEE